MKPALFASLTALALLAAAPAHAMSHGHHAHHTEAAKPDEKLTAAIANPARQERHRVRDAQRNPAETLAFFGLKPGQTVLEIVPGSGYYAEILSVYAKDTGGTYIATGNPIATLADEAAWGKITYTPFGPDAGPMAPAGTVDLALTFRNIHNFMWREGFLDKVMADFAAALKPGGVLGVVEHRADPRAELTVGGRIAGDGYVSKATVVAAAERAGLVFDGESEINANPKDTKDHPFGVWMLPPNLRNAAPGGTTPADYDAEKYKAIGESDRMTLRFRKPS